MEERKKTRASQAINQICKGENPKEDLIQAWREKKF